jgi:lactate dehydrogenase-like 2-hydroxyacid dehydrogenase
MKGLYALKEGRVAGAGLNVYAKESEGEPALIPIKNFILAPHIVSASHPTCLRMATIAA